MFTGRHADCGKGAYCTDGGVVYGCNRPVDAPGCPGDQIECTGTGAGACPAEQACVSGCCMPIVDQ